MREMSVMRINSEAWMFRQGHQACAVNHHSEKVGLPWLAASAFALIESVFVVEKTNVFQNAMP
jgi:hypothetical protein